MNWFTWIEVGWTSVVIPCLLHFCLWTVIIAYDGRREEREMKEVSKSEGERTEREKEI